MRMLALCAAAAVAACATPTEYQRAQSHGDLGYSEMALEQDRYRVTFRSGADTGVQAARDYALRRAANLTLERGYDWFEVTDRITEPAPASSGPQFSIGLGGADFGRSSAIGGGVGIGFGGGGNRGNGAITTLEIVMGEGPRPDSANAYDARAVAASLSGMQSG